MKIDRLIGIITILLQQDKVTAPELAERFEVSRRTINRDIEDICKAGIPLLTTQGYGGGIAIAEGYKLDKSVLTQEEVQTILAGLKGMDSVSSTSYFTKLLEKLSSKESRVEAGDIIIIDLASHYQDSLTPKIAAIKKAALERHTISFLYYSQKVESQREIEPYRLVFKWSSWYVWGYCLEKKAFRLFKLNRLWQLTDTGHCFPPRTISEDKLNFDNYFALEPIHLTAVFRQSEKHRLIDEYGVDCYSVQENGMLRLEREFVSYHHMREWILSFGDKVSVLKPEELELDRLRQARNILKNHRRHDI